jgi:glycosidase
VRWEERTYPRGSLRLRFTTNHDKNYWDVPAVERYGSDGLKLATVLVFTLPGVPLIFTGEEVANDRRLDHHDKVDVDWTRPRWMQQLFGALTELRRRHEALRSGDYQPVATDDDEVLAFSRATSSERVLVVLNFSRQRRTVRLRAPRLAGVLLEEDGRSLRVPEDGGLSMTVGGRAHAILAARP